MSQGGADPTAAAEYILQALLAQIDHSTNNNQREKLVFHHVTCATDTENIRVVFNAVRMTVLARSLEEVQVM